MLGAHRIPLDGKFQMAYVVLILILVGGVQIAHTRRFARTFHVEKPLTIYSEGVCTETSNFSTVPRHTQERPSNTMGNFHHPLAVLEQGGNQENQVPAMWTVDRGSRLGETTFASWLFAMNRG